MARTLKPWDELTDEQKKNRIKNEKAKKKNNPVSYIGSLPTPKKIPAVKRDGMTWSNLGHRLASPTSVLSIVSIGILSTYLSYQFYLSNDLVTGVVVEFLGIVFAGIIASNQSKWVRFGAGLCLGGIIFFSATVLHHGLASNRAHSDHGLKAVQSEYDLITSQVQAIQDQINSLPSSYVSKRSELGDQIKPLMATLSGLRQEIDTKVQPTGSDFASIVIRVLCMIANLIMVHRLIIYIRK